MRIGRVAWTVVCLAACARGGAEGFDSAAGDAAQAPRDAGGSAAQQDANAPPASGDQDSAAPIGSDAGGTAVDAAKPPDASSAGLDPLLSLPDPSGVACGPPGYGGPNGCPGSMICRIATTSGGRCEGCTSCGHLNDSCSASADCDILFQCYAGKCTAICNLATPQTCGGHCIDVGNAGSGVCEAL